MVFNQIQSLVSNVRARSLMLREYLVGLLVCDLKSQPLFEEYFLKTFSSRLAEYTDPKINVQSQKKLNKNYTIVSSVLIETDQRPEIKIDWRIYTKNPDKLLIRDLIIEGLSLARTQKEEFNSIIQNNDGDIKALFSSLRQFINKKD